jgi:hypothetical protein
MLSGLAPAINATLKMLTQDPLLRKTITYRHFTGEQVFNEELGHTEDGKVDYQIPSIPLRHDERSVQLYGESKVQVGDLLYIIRAKDLQDAGLSRADITQKDVILDEDETRKIQAISWILNFAVSITVAG